MIQVVEKGKIPVYETECEECHSKIRYLRKDLVMGDLVCPQCGCKIICSPSIERVDCIGDDDYICSDVGDVLKDLTNQINGLIEKHYGPSHFRIVDDYIRGIQDCQEILEETKENWKA